MPGRIRDLTGGAGADHYVELVGTSQTMLAGIRSLGRGGKLVIIGYTDEHLDLHPIELILSEIQIVSSVAASRRDLVTAVQLAAAAGSRRRSTPATRSRRSEPRSSGSGHGRCEAATSSSGRCATASPSGDLRAGGMGRARPVDRGPRLRQPLDHGLVAARGRLLRLRDAGARATSSITVGTAVTNPLTRHPAITANAFGRSASSRPAGRLRHRRRRSPPVRARPSDGEARDAARHDRRHAPAVAGETVDGEVGSWRFAGGHLRSPVPEPPVYVSASQPKALELTGEVADGLILLAGLFPEGLAFAREHGPRP